MSNIGNINTGSTPNTVNQSSGDQAVQSTSFQHGQLGAGTAAGLESSLFEEAAMNIASSRKIETKDSRKDKDILKKLLEESRNKVPDLPEVEKLDLCLQQLKKNMESGTLNEDAIREQLGNYSDDATHQYLALEDLIAYLRTPGDQQNLSLAESLEQYGEKFYENCRTEIQAGINVSGIAHEFSETSALGNTADLRNIWRSALEVPEITSASEAFSFAMEKVGGEYKKVGEGIRWMTDALARELDLAQAERSVEPARMQYVRSQLENVFGVKTAYETCVQLESSLERLIRNERQN